MADPSSGTAAPTVVAVDWFRDRRVLVCGARFAGAAAARALLAAGAHVIVTDAGRPEGLPALIAAGAEFEPELHTAPGDVELIVASPGWRPSHPVFASAAAAGVPIIGEVELAWRLRGPAAAPWLAVTGTNGKTTTVRMLEAMLRAAGLRAMAVGNVGVSIIDAVLAEPGYDVLAVELSSFQLYWPSTFAPVASAVLNLAPDHLDWHRSMAEYADTKARIWVSGVAIGNEDDAEVARRLSIAVDASGAAATPLRRVGFTLRPPAPGQFGCVDGVLVDNAFGTGIALIGAEDVRPAGAHNVANALAAAALARAHGVAADAVAGGLRDFVPDPHRNQFVVSVGGVDYVDDSKATNPHAASASLSSYPRIVWIAGGQLKGAPVDGLVALIADRLRGVVLLGADRDQIHAALSRHAPDVPVIDVALTDHGAMSEVVTAAAVLARPGDTVLLAPAAASYDMFSGYPERGARFAAAVHRLPGAPASPATPVSPAPPDTP